MRHLWIRAFLADSDNAQVLVDLLQDNRSLAIFKHNLSFGILGGHLVFQGAVVWWTLERLDVLLWTLIGVYFGDVDDHVDEVGADLVRAHVHWRCVGGDVDLG